MKGRELFEKYTSRRDYTESKEDEYAQLLDTIYSQIGDDLFDLLEQAQILNKHLSIIETDGDSLIDLISKEDIIFI